MNVYLKGQLFSRQMFTRLHVREPLKTGPVIIKVADGSELHVAVVQLAHRATVARYAGYITSDFGRHPAGSYVEFLHESQKVDVTISKLDTKTKHPDFKADDWKEFYSAAASLLKQYRDKVPVRELVLA